MQYRGGEIGRTTRRRLIEKAPSFRIFFQLKQAEEEDKRKTRKRGKSAHVYIHFLMTVVAIHRTPCHNSTIVESSKNATYRTYEATDNV